jgi:uncharacterized protein YaiE (UPF0345 family)
MRFVELYQQIQSKAGSDDADLLVVIKLEINNVLADLETRMPEAHWLRAERKFSTISPETSGTATVTKGSRTVTRVAGTAGSWRTYHIGAYFQASGDSEYYKIDEWVAQDTLKLQYPYIGANGTKSYKLWTGEYHMPGDCLRIDHLVEYSLPVKPFPLEQRKVALAIPNLMSHGAVGAPTAWWYVEPARAEIYSTGTVATMTKGDRTVVGNAGTNWAASGVVLNDLSFRLATLDEPYTITEVIDNTNLELSDAWRGENQAGTLAYLVGVPGTYRIALYPIPDDNYLIGVRYQRQFPRLFVANDVPLLPIRFHQTLLKGAEYRVMRHLGYDQRAMTVESEFERGVEAIEREGMEQNDDIETYLERRPDPTYYEGPQFRLPSGYETWTPY